MAATARSHIAHDGAFWVITVIFTLVMAYSTVPTPLYPLYQQLDGFPVSILTLIFAAYAVGVVVSLFFVGHVSDWVGRRKVLTVAVLISAASAAMFLLWTEVPGLLAARLVNGFSIGVLTATATAHLGELRARARPSENVIIAASVAGAANLGGLALGPLIGGLFAEYLPAPLVLPHAVFLVLLLVAAVVVTRVPETADLTAHHWRYRPQRLAAPKRGRSTFIAAAFGAFTGFALFGLFTALAPTILIGTFDERDHLLAGVTTFAVFAAAAVGQVVFGRVDARVQLTVAAACCGVGLLTFAGGALIPSLPVFLSGGVVSGVGVGVLFKSAIATAGRLADARHRGEILALTFFIAYCGLAVPAILIGVALTFVPQLAVLLAFAALVLVGTTTAALAMRRQTAGP